MDKRQPLDSGGVPAAGEEMMYSASHGIFTREGVPLAEGFDDPVGDLVPTVPFSLSGAVPPSAVSPALDTEPAGECRQLWAGRPLLDTLDTPPHPDPSCTPCPKIKSTIVCEPLVDGRYAVRG